MAGTMDLSEQRRGMVMSKRSRLTISRKKRSPKLPDADLHHGLEGAWLLGFSVPGADVYMGMYTTWRHRKLCFGGAPFAARDGLEGDVTHDANRPLG